MSVYHVCVNVTAAMRYSVDMLADLFWVSEDKVSEVRTRSMIAPHATTPVYGHC